MGNRAATVVVVSRFEKPLSPGHLPGPDSGLRDLEGAREAAEAVAEQFERAGFTVTRQVDPKAKKLGRRVISDLKAASADDLQIIHVISHGTIAEGIDKLQVIGREGTVDEDCIVERWVETVEGNRNTRPLTLFLLDTCFSGRATEFPWQARAGGSAPRALVMAASDWDDRAYEFRLSRALADLLENATELDVDPALPHLRWDLVARTLRAKIIALSDGGFVQEARSTRVDPAVVDFNHFAPFFPNPKYRKPTPIEAARSEAPATVAPFIQGIDAGLFLNPALGGHLSGLPGLFRGRKIQLRELSEWLDQPVGKDQLRIVTGDPGSGKSAILGVIVCAGVERLREATRGAWAHLPRVPCAMTGVAAIHARNRGLQQLIDAIADQLGLVKADGGAWDAESVTNAIGAMPNPPTVILDALDEATDPSGLVSVLLVPLLRASRADGRAACRALIGTRSGDRWPSVRPLLEVATIGQTIDLNVTDAAVLASDLEEYVHAALTVDLRWDQAPDGTATRVARAVAAELSRSHATYATDSDQSGWGAFLVATLFTRYLRDNVHSSDAAAVDGALRSLPTSLPEVLELDLAHDADDRRRTLLTAFSIAKGEGIPLAIASAIADRLAVVQDAVRPQLGNTIESVQFYLRAAVDDDGVLLYRPFHQGLADYLAGRLTDSERSVIVTAMVSDLARSKDRVVWSSAPPYVTRHLLDHAADAGLAQGLLADNGLVVAAEPAAVLEAFRRTGGQPTARRHLSRDITSGDNGFAATRHPHA